MTSKRSLATKRNPSKAQATKKVAKAHAGKRIGDLRDTESSSGVDWEQSSRGTRPALCVFCYLDGDLHDNAPTFADVLERYVDCVGVGVLRSYVARSGYPEKLTEKVVRRDLAHLRALPKKHMGIHVQYDSSVGQNPPGTFGIKIDDTKRDPELWGSTEAGVVRIDFPFRWLEQYEVEPFVDFVAGLVALPCVGSANAGFTFKRTSHSENSSEWVHDRLHRLLGFDPCDDDFTSKQMGGRSPTAHWVNYIDNERARKVGGPDAIAAALPTCDVRRLSTGVLVRGAKRPPIGDLVDGAKDLGCLPAVARLLAPIRADESEASTTQGLARLDDLEIRSWDNERR